MAKKHVFNYDVFLSYKSQEESWARRLADTLRGFGQKVWRDHDAGDGIRLSEKWTKEVEAGIRSSRTMLVLWSKLIKEDATSVVHREITAMHNLIQADPIGQRKFVPIALDGTSFENYAELAPYQGDLSLKRLYQRAGATGAENISALEWYGAITDLVGAIGVKDVTEVRFLAAAMTRDQAVELWHEPDKYATNPEAFLLIRDLMEKTSAFNPERYGASANDWKPFPQVSHLTVRGLVDTFASEKRAWARDNNEFTKWLLVSYSDEMLSNNAKTRKFARSALIGGPCLVLLDPVSLMHKTIYQRVITNGGLQNHSDGFIIGVAPVITQMHKDLYKGMNEIESKLEELLEEAYARFQQPYVPDTRTCVLNVEHEFQLRRWLQVAANGIVTANRTPLRARAIDPTVFEWMRTSATSEPGPEVIRIGATVGATS